MDINPKVLYTIAEVAEMTNLSVNQVHQAKYKNKITVQQIYGEVEQVLGNDVIKFMDTQYYKDRSKKYEIESDSSITEVICEDAPTSQQLTIFNKKSGENNIGDMIKEVFTTLGDKEVHVHIQLTNNYYYGRGE